MPILYAMGKCTATPLSLHPSSRAFPPVPRREDLFFAGQITGVEGYMGNIATGLLAGINISRVLQQQSPLILPVETMLGALCHYVTHADLKDFQPMKANFGILPALPHEIRGKRERAARRVEISLPALQQTLQAHAFTPALTTLEKAS
jgi:methylenetetrahydrofolate--tRNA-(uracil-5-)-methyltransferase